MSQQFSEQEQQQQALKQFATDRGWRITKEQPIAHGVQIVLARSHELVNVNIYKSGKVVVGGKSGPGRDEVQQWANYAARPDQNNGSFDANHIGADESGKGDLFGPLAVAAVAVDPDISDKLIRLNVRDSKSVSDSVIPSIAHMIIEACPHSVTTLMPKQYNQLYIEHGSNLNLLLAWAHATNIAKLSREVEVDYVLLDQFSENTLLLEDALTQALCNLPLRQRTKAESDIAVAAASILARDAFLKGIKQLREELSVKLPLGSSSPEIRQTAVDIQLQLGRDVLGRVAKMHFSTVSDLR